MAARRRAAKHARSAPPAFRAHPVVVAADHPSGRQSTALVAVLVLVAAAIAAVSYLVRPDDARSFDLLHGSVFLTDQVAPVGIDLASGKPTLRLVGADKQVGAARTADLSLVNVDDGTLLLDRVTGEFNMVDDTGFVIKHDGGGVLLTRRADRTTSVAVAAGGGSQAGVAGAAYIVRTGPGGTNLLLVNQSNVETASRGSRTVAPRASLTTTEVADTGVGTVAGADGDLWVLFGAGNQHTVRELSVPPNSSTGARLRSVDHGTVDGPAVIGTATTGADGSDTALAVASDTGIRYFPPATTGSATGKQAGKERTFTFRSQPGVNAILPVSNAQGRIAFVMHATAGWSVVSVAADGTDLRGPTAITGIPASAKLAPPAWSDNALYTVDSSVGRGRLYSIAANGRGALVAGASTYPVVSKIETSDVSDAYVLARGPRVLVNSPSHADAVALFTDGSRRPLVVQKSSAVDVSAAGGAEALTRNNLDPSDENGKNPRPGAAPPRNANQQINNNVDCKSTDQKPHIPQLTAQTPGSRSVVLNWTYPVIDPQDCYPSSYVVTARAVSPGAASPGGSVKVQGQTSVNLTGLSPTTEYEITVTAYLDGKGTSSPPIRVTTGLEGPAAPTGLQVTADSAGNWHLQWTGCGTARTCIPVSTWHVVPAFCDGRGVSGAPAPIDVSADPSSRLQPPTTYRGSDALLGRGLSFRVEGTGLQGATGTPSASSACVYSWTAPVAGAISVSASSPAPTDTTSTTSITAAVQFASGAVHDLGGVGGQLTYKLLSGDQVISTQGPTAATSVRLPGIQPGRDYQVQVTAIPPRHPEAAVTLPAVQVDPAIAPWPDLSVSTSFDTNDFSTGTLDVTFAFPAGTDTHGETFDLTDSSALTCGSSGYQLAATDIADGQKMSFPNIDRFTYNGDCSVRVQLQQHGSTETSPPLFGAGNSAAASAGVSIPLPTSTTTAADFTAQWTGDETNPQVQVTYQGKDHLTTTLATGWTIAVTNGSACGSVQNNPPPATVPVDTGCIKAGGPFTVSVDYTYLGSGQHFDGIPVTGTAPRPVDPSKIDFDNGTWAGTADAPVVDIAYTGTEDRDRLKSLDWSETVTSSGNPGVACGHDKQNPGDQDLSIAVDLNACPPTDSDGNPVTYRVEVDFQDPTYGQQGTYPQNPTQVSGTPPT